LHATEREAIELGRELKLTIALPSVGEMMNKRINMWQIKNQVSIHNKLMA